MGYNSRYIASTCAVAYSYVHSIKNNFISEPYS